MKNPRVSIIIPVYNVEDYIERSVVSLFEQTLEDMEFVFVDDCSPDKSIEILCKILLEYPQRKSQVKIIRHDYNKGVAAARNTGLNNATGEFVGWVDPDDWVEADMFATLYDKAIRNDCDLVWCDIVDEYVRTSQYTNQNAEEKSSILLKKTLTTLSFGSLCNKLVKHSIYTKNHLWCIDGANMMEDRILLARVLYFCKVIKYVPSGFYHYRKEVPKSMTNGGENKGMKHLEESYINLNCLESFFKEHHVYEDFAFSCNLLRLIMKQHLLYTTKIEDLELWATYQPEANRYVCFSPELRWRHKCIGMLIYYKLWPIIRFWLYVKQVKSQYISKKP